MIDDEVDEWDRDEDGLFMAMSQHDEAPQPVSSTAAAQPNHDGDTSAPPTAPPAASSEPQPAPELEEWDDPLVLGEEFLSQMSQHSPVHEPPPPTLPPLPAATLQFQASLHREPHWQAIVDTQLRPGQTLKISAAAGSGKTTLFVDYVAARLADGTLPRDRTSVLFLAFNTSVRKEVDLKFDQLGLSNYVEVRTVNALAKQAVYPDGGVDTDMDGARGMAKRAKDRGEQDRGLAYWKVAECALKRFMWSDEPAVTEAHVDMAEADVRNSTNLIKTMKPETLAKLKVAVLEAVAGLWTDAKQALADVRADPRARINLKPSHSAYTKMWQLDPDALRRSFEPYELVLLDEGHGMSRRAAMSALWPSPTPP